MTTSPQAGKAIISQDGRTAMVSISVSFLQRGGRKQILSPPGAAPWSPAPRVDSALVKAVVRAHRWRQMLESGEYASSAELAKAEKVNDSYLSRILRLTLLAPDIIEAILSGRQTPGLELLALVKGVCASIVRPVAFHRLRYLQVSPREDQPEELAIGGVLWTFRKISTDEPQYLTSLSRRYSGIQSSLLMG